MQVYALRKYLESKPTCRRGRMALKCNHDVVFVPYAHCAGPMHMYIYTPMYIL